MKTSIEAPWGEFHSDHTNPMRTFYRQTLAQLRFFQKDKDTEYIRRDIEGYEKLLAYDSEEICHKFQELKIDAIKDGKKVFKDNLAVLDRMKELKII